MSKIRGIFPAFLATAIGIGNGIWVFGPAFKDLQQEKEEQAKKAVEVAKLSENGTHDTPEALRKAEAAASRTIATESVLKPVEKGSYWWPNMSLWTKEVNKPPILEPAKNGQEASKDKQ
ncbi:hypothetical protein BKA65DRAFT_495939 [Rhexocercosporidium sp. MPI-PUGE-AT-0058]|nr:hypothetical protein BKA65DRAFT_495939 [Rhexocercosporidium sp. MPI-PUGE-AT-0058]